MNDPEKGYRTKIDIPTPTKRTLNCASSSHHAHGAAASNSAVSAAADYYSNEEQYYISGTTGGSGDNNQQVDDDYDYDDYDDDDEDDQAENYYYDDYYNNGGGGGQGQSGTALLTNHRRGGDRSSSGSSPDARNKLCGSSHIWCVRDICGVICSIFTWFLVMYAEFVVLRIILLPSTYTWYRNINGIIWQSLAFLALVSHAKTMFTDPGAVPRGNATKEMIQLMGFRKGQVIYKCPKCCSIKPKRAHHCSVCQRCIKKMDHHCPWVNNCVGENNQKYFVLFTFYIALTSIHSLILAVNHFIICIHNEWKDCLIYSPPSTVIFLIFLIFEALLFAIFTIIMLCTQMQAIWLDETGIEQLKKEEAQWAKKSRWKSLQVVFGRFSIGWLSPFTKPPLSAGGSNSNKRPSYIGAYFPV